MESFFGVVLGWALGLAGNLLGDSFKKKKKTKEIKKAISSELHEVAFQLLTVVYRIECRLGTINREFLEWVYPHVQRYSGPNPKDGILTGISGLLSCSDEELKALSAHERETSSSVYWPFIGATYSAIAINQAHDFEPEYTVRVFDILSHLRMFNDIRENGLAYNRMTFEPGLSEENLRRIVKNADDSDLNLQKRAQIVIEKITELEN